MCRSLSKANIEKALVQILRKDVILLEQRSVEMASGYKQKEEAARGEATRQ